MNNRFKSRAIERRYNSHVAEIREMIHTWREARKPWWVKLSKKLYRPLKRRVLQWYTRS